MVSQDNIDKAVSTLVNEAHPLRVILFGSYARGEAKEESDVDFLVIYHELHQPRQEMTRLRRLLSPLHIPVDLLVVSEEHYDKWSEAPSTTLYWAKREGKVMYDAA